MGPAVELTLLRATAGGGWESAGADATQWVTPARPFALRVVNLGSAPVHVAVLARGPAGRVRVLAAPEEVAAGATTLIGADGRIGLAVGERVVAVGGGDPVAVQRLVAAVADSGYLAPDRVPPGVAVHEFGVPMPPYAALPDRPRGYERRRVRAVEAVRDLWHRRGGAPSPPHAEPPAEQPPAEPPTAGAGDPEPLTAGGAAGAADDPAATRTAYGRLDAPGVVVAETEFEVVVGISAQPAEGTLGTGMTIPDERVRGDYAISVLLVADGCRLRGGEAWRHDLLVTGDDPYPSVTLHLTSAAFDGGIGARTLQALYSVDGATVGMATRSVAVLARMDTTVPPQARPDGGLFAYALPEGYPVPDLTVRILTAPELPAGTLLWDVDSPHAGVPRPPQAIPMSIGGDPREFAKNLVRDVNAHEGKPDLLPTLRGYADTIAERVPTEVLDALRAAAAAAPARAPSVLLLSAEPYVPWELALVDPPLDPAAPPFLGAQAALGRWVLGNRKPVQPPPAHVDVDTIAVVNGVYALPGWERLTEAEAEAAALATTYAATPVAADLPSVVALLGGQPPARALHFALHGKYDPKGVADGLKLVDGEFLPPTTVRGSTLAHAPFVYLNACQVGSGNAVLGDYAGLAAAFLHAGASAVVAPLWSIDDGLAREVALRLYAALFGRTTAGEALRRERAAFAATAAPTSATVLAYQFFGHPEMTVTRR